MIRWIMRWLLAVSLAVTSTAAAGDPGPASTAASDPELLIPAGARHGGWGGPVVLVSTVRDRAALLVGGRGGWLIDGRFTIGGGGFGLANRIPAPAEVQGAGERLDLELGYGGGWLEYTFRPVRLVHVSVGALVGGGGVSLRFHRGGSEGSDTDAFFVVEPTVMAELNLARPVRAIVGVSYRVIAGADMPGLSYSDLSGPSAVFAVKFGSF
jgi:hypothetical protein